jgi:glyoxylase-like metal-dependent hydrolase (beta-lactamase superfamily II)
MVEILSGVHQVDGVNSNTYLIVEDDGSLTLIDTGMSSGGKRVLDYVKTTLAKQPSDIKVIVITHAHVDHIRGARAIKNATGAKVAIHEEDAGYLAGTSKLPWPKGAAGYLFRIFSIFFRSPKVDPEIRLNDNEAIPNSKLRVVYTPGHTPGSITLYDEGRKVVFVGDAIITRGGKLDGPPKQFTIDSAKAQASIEKISTLDFETLLSGHGDPIKSGGSQKVRESFARH